MTKDLLDDLLREVRRRFYAEADARTFFAQRRWLIRAITWPAVWLKRHGFGSEVTPQAYRRLILTVLSEIEEHGTIFGRSKSDRSDASDRSDYFPTYLLKCLQDHCQRHIEAVLYDFKLLRNRVDLTAIVGVLKSGAAPAPSLVDTFAEAHELLRAPKRRPATGRARAETDRQLAMF